MDEMHHNFTWKQMHENFSIIYWQKEMIFRDCFYIYKILYFNNFKLKEMYKISYLVLNGQKLELIL